MIATLKSLTTTGRVVAGVVAAVLAVSLAVIFYLTITAGPRERAREAERYARDLEQARKADATASDQRRIDTIIIHQKEKALSDAVNDLPDARPSPRRVALACQRLRNQGTPEANLPAVCRSGG